METLPDQQPVPESPSPVSVPQVPESSSSPALPKLVLALLGILFLVGVVYLLSMRKQVQEIPAEAVPSITILPTQSLPADDLNTLEQDLNTTDVTDDPSLYNEIETELNNL